MAKISLHGLEKGEVLAALYNASRPLGMGFLQYDPKPMTAEEGASLVASQTYFDYLKGRVMKIDLKGDELETWLYDRDNGSGAAERAINELRKTKSVNTASIQDSHKSGLLEAAVAQESMGRDHAVHEEDMGIALSGKPSGVKATVITMGLSDMKGHLAPKVAAAVEQVADTPVMSGAGTEEKQEFPRSSVW